MTARGSRQPTPDNRQVLRWRRPVGLIVLLVLIALFVTSLFRSPNPVWTVVTAILVIGLAAGLVWDALRRRADGRRRTTP